MPRFNGVGWHWLSCKPSEHINGHPPHLTRVLVRDSSLHSETSQSGKKGGGQVLHSTRYSPSVSLNLSKLLPYPLLRLDWTTLEVGDTVACNGHQPLPRVYRPRFRVLLDGVEEPKIIQRQRRPIHETKLPFDLVPVLIHLTLCPYIFGGLPFSGLECYAVVFCISFTTSGCARFGCASLCCPSRPTV